jgi:hypothetical protein
LIVGQTVTIYIVVAYVTDEVAVEILLAWIGDFWASITKIPESIRIRVSDVLPVVLSDGTQPVDGPIQKGCAVCVMKPVLENPSMFPSQAGYAKTQCVGEYPSKLSRVPSALGLHWHGTVM